MRRQPQVQSSPVSHQPACRFYPSYLLSISKTLCSVDTPPVLTPPSLRNMAWTLRSRRPVADGSRSVDATASGIDSGVKTASALITPEETHDSSKPNLASLPPEIHLAISQLLIYPDALSLKHTNRHFYGLVDTGVNLKVDWLMQRRSLHLECPNDRRCDLGSDLRFCRGSVP